MLLTCMWGILLARRLLVQQPTIHTDLHKQFNKSTAEGACSLQTAVSGIEMSMVCSVVTQWYSQSDSTITTPFS